MRVWIDATHPGSRMRVFGLTLVERHLRVIAAAERKSRALFNAVQSVGIDGARRKLEALAASHGRPSEIAIEISPDDPEPDWIPADLLVALPIRWVREPGTTRERLQRALRDSGGEPTIALAGDTVVDDRVFEHLAWQAAGSTAFIHDDGPSSAAALRLEEPLPDSPGTTETLLEIARECVRMGAIKQTQADDVESYIKKLRRDLAPFAFQVSNDVSRRRVERFLFDSNYKGSTDFMTKWVYPPLVWRILHFLTQRSVKPNSVTFVGIVACFSAVPFFATGMWVPGLVLAYLMSVLDSVDGKLARLTYQSSAQGDVLDHGMDLVHPPFWYWAWGWALSGGDVGAGVFQASMWMVVFYIFDRVMEMLFTAGTGKSIHGYSAVDARMRTFISRRNVNLAVFTVALAFGMAVPAFYAIVAWQAASALFHLSRVIKFWNVNETESLTTR